jgi:hypothetical protein
MTDRDDERPATRNGHRPRSDRRPTDERPRSDRRPTDERPRSDRRPTTTRTMTDTDRRDDAGAQQLADVDHTNPNTDRSFGGNFTFARGGAVAADGGRPDVVPEEEAASGEAEDDEDGDTLGDVEHTPPNESDDTNRVFERGATEADE